jgi:hypothetical protein
MMIILFLDVNVLLHYQQFRNVNWLAICQGDGTFQVEVRLARTVMDTLDRFKYSHDSKKLRHRSNDILKAIDDTIEHHDGVLREGLRLALDDEGPVLSIYGEFNLNHQSDDDNLIANVLHYSKAHPSHQVHLVTGDVGLRHRASARHMSVLRMPSELRLQDEPDSRDRQIHELKVLLEKQALRAPDLKLAITGSRDWAEVNLPPYAAPTESETQRKLAEIRAAFPMRDKNQLPDSIRRHAGLFQQNDIDPAKVTVPQLISASIAEIYKTFSAIDHMKILDFYRNYEAFLAAEVQYSSQMARTIQLGLILENRGTCPAEDIDMRIKFPLGMQIVFKEGLPQKPVPPQPPTWAASILPSPRTAAAQIASGITLDVKKAIDGSILEANISRIKHLFVVTLPPVFVIFDGEENVKSFKVNYSLYASNVPHSVTGELNLKVTRNAPIRGRLWRNRRRKASTIPK